MKKFFTYTFFIIPFLYITFSLFFNSNIINIQTYLITSSGYIALSLIVIILFIPNIPVLYKIIDRRLLGLITFIFSFIHLIFYFFDNNFNLAFLKDDFINLSFIQIGYFTLLLFLPLILTSNDVSKKNLGNMWYKIHKLIYLILVLSMIHYYMIIKADYLIFSFYLLAILVIFFLNYRRN